MLRKMVTPNCVAAINLDLDDERYKNVHVNFHLVKVDILLLLLMCVVINANCLCLLLQLQSAITKVKKRFLANAQVFEKDTDHCLVCFFKKVGSKYILGHDDYYCHLEAFVLTSEPVVVSAVVRTKTAHDAA